MYQTGYELIHPDTNELHAIFEGYTDTGEEIWRTPNGIETCTFEGFTDDGWCQWSQSVQEFREQVQDD